MQPSPVADVQTPLLGEAGMEAAVNGFDWSRTPLGASTSWPQSLRTVVRLMLDSRYAMWLAWGPELTFFCNDAYRPTLGTKTGFIGAPASQVWAEIWPDIGPRIDRVLSTATATYDEGLCLFLERSGFREETYHTFSYSPVRGDSGAVEGMLCVVTEETERVLAQRRLTALAALSSSTMGAHDVAKACQAALAVLAAVAADVPFAMIFLVDEGGQSFHLSSACGLAPAALADAAALGAELSSQVAAAGAPADMQVWSHFADVLPAACALWNEPVQRAVVLPLARYGLENRQSGFLIAGVSPRLPLDEAYKRFFTLVATQVETGIANALAFDAERRRAEELAVLDKAKTTFFSNISHELRTPLTLIASPIEELLANESAAPRRELLEMTQRNALRLQRLVNTLLEFARIEAGRVEAVFEPVDLAELTRNLASVFRSAMEQAGLRYDVVCDELPQLVAVDREMWEKIVLNLVSNAFKFTLSGAVSVRLCVKGEAVVLTVADTGAGVPPHEIPRLFERFHRVQGVSGRTQEGSGIGLALVQELVRLHGGSVDAHSEVGRGATFNVRLPLPRGPAVSVDSKAMGHALAGAGADAFLQEALGWSGSAPAASAAAAAATAASAATADQASGAQQDRRFADTFGARIVLADDNADMRAYIHRLLSPMYDVEGVADGEQALAAVRQRRADLVLSDIMMPRLDGFGLLRTLRADASLARVPVILISARAGEEARLESLDAGADDYVVKPFSARELVARVGAMLERARQITEREALVESLRLRTAQFEGLLNAAPLGVYVVDADLRIVEVNPTARPVFGDVPDLIGQDFAAVMHLLWPQGFADELVHLFRHTLATGEPYFTAERIEKRLDRDTTEYYEWRINRLPLPDGRPGVVCYFRDISEHVQSRRKLEASDRQKDEFLAMLAHELRNPLAPIRSAGDLLSRLAASDARVQTAADILRRQVNLLSRLVDDLLDVSRITQKRIELAKAPLHLADVVAQAVETVAPLMEEKKHRLEVSSAAPLRVCGDAARLVQCVVNVLANAAKYTDEGGTIRVTTFADSRQAVVNVSDNGTGIAADLLPYVFDLFVQSNRTLDRSQGGLGIGLSLVKRLVELHGGSVAAASGGPGLGATIEIRLPLMPPSNDVAVPPVAPALRALNVLVVDDNVDAAQTLQLVLELEGHTVKAVHSSAEALHSILTAPPEIVLLDIGLPVMDGYEVARRVRASAIGSAVKLIALTGYGRAEDRQQAFQAGFDEHLVKPVEHGKLMDSLERIAKL